MPENGFLQGLFLKEQLEAARRNQEAQIAASKEMQNSSQQFTREQNEIQQKNWLQDFALRAQQNATNKRQLELGNAGQMAQLLGSGTIEKLNGPQFTAPTFKVPGNDVAQLPDMEPAPGQPDITSLVVGGEMDPARSGSIVEFGAGQKFLVPDQQQRFLDKSQQSLITNQQAIDQKIAMADQIVKLFPSAGPFDQMQMRSKILTGQGLSPEHIDTGIAEANTEMYMALKAGDDAGFKISQDKRNALVNIKNGFLQTQAQGRAATQDPFRPELFQATQFLSKIDPYITLEAKKLFPGSAVLSDVQKAQAATYILDRPDLQQKYGIKIDPSKISFIRMALKRIQTGYGEDESIPGTVGQIKGAQTAPPPTPNADINWINNLRKQQGLPPLPAGTP